jgi:hypothetical protein
MKDFFQSIQFKRLIILLGGIVAALLIFQLGVFVGFRKANFAFRWGENYHTTFGGPKNGFLGEFEGRDYINGHGVSGNVIKIEGDILVIKSGENVEKKVVADFGTTVRKGRETLKISEIKIDDQIVVIGSPKDDGSILAKLIRVFDPARSQSAPLSMPVSNFKPF